MALPTYDQLIEPLLRHLAAHPGGMPAREAHEHLAQVFGIGDVDRQQLLPSGSQPVYKNRAGWAHDRLKRAGLSSSPRRGFWQVTAQGVDFLKQAPRPFPPTLLSELATGYLGIKLNPTGAKATGDAPALLVVEQHASPDDRLAQALKELRASAEAELQQVLSQVSPAFFETLVLDLLHRMGYGASREDLQRVGGSGDGGIDGVIALDRLGLEKVYVQAKRWQGSVGRPDLQAFFGALAGQKARKGIFITTSGFTAQALEFARSVEGIVLIDGPRLAGLMIDCELGVTARTVRIPKIDFDYFDEDAL